MSEITRVVRAAGRRLFLMELLKALVLSVFIALSLMVVLRIVQQSFGLAIEWRTVMILAGSIAAAGTLVWSLVARPRELDSARVLDERAGLRESLSTALTIGTPKEAWSQLVVETARQKAASVKVGDAIPIEAPKRWHWPLAAALALGIAWSLPTWDLLGTKAKREEEANRAKEVIAVKTEINENKKKLDELLAKVAPELKSEQTDPSKAEEVAPSALQKPEQMRASEIKRLTDLSEKLAAKAGGEKGLQMDALKNMMAQLKHPGDSPMNELFKSLSKGDFSGANEALNEMKAQLAKNEMTPEEKEKLAKAMEKLAEQIQKQADAAKDIAKALEQAGADPQQAQEMAKQLAANPDMIKKALEAMKNLTPEQREKLAKEMAAKAKAAQKASQMAKSMSQCSGSMQEGEMGEASDAMSEMAGELSEMEMTEAELQAMDRALKECQSQLAGMCNGDGEGEGESEGWNQQEGEWKEGDSNRMGKGGKGGGPGKGEGKREGQTPTEFATEQQKIKTKTGKGPIIGKQYVKGEQIVGESAAEYAEAVDASGKAAAEALSNGEVPPELRKTVQSYFGALKKQTEKKDGAKPADAKPEEKK
ncbi:MAG: hypothetical protein HEQ23_03505 [Tepidisphaera sp.]